MTENGYNDGTVKEIHQRCTFYSLGDDSGSKANPPTGGQIYPIHNGSSNILAHDGHVELVNADNLGDWHCIRVGTIDSHQAVYSVYTRVYRSAEDPNTIIEL